MALSVGAPHGWGPVGLSEQQVDTCLARIKALVEPKKVGSWREVGVVGAGARREGRRA